MKKMELSRNDKEWMKRMMRSGTFRDKVSALSIYIQENPKYTISTMKKMLEMSEKKGSKD